MVALDGGVMCMRADMHMHLLYCVLALGICVPSWAWYLIMDEHCCPQRSTAHVIPAEMECSLLFKNRYSGYRRENCKDISS